MAADKYTGNGTVRALVWDAVLEALDYVQMSSLSSAVALSSIPDGAKVALLQAEQQAVRIRLDGVNPTASVGMILTDGQLIFINSPLENIRVIQAASGAKLNIQYFARGEFD